MPEVVTRSPVGAEGGAYVEPTVLDDDHAVELAGVREFTNARTVVVA